MTRRRYLVLACLVVLLGVGGALHATLGSFRLTSASMAPTLGTGQRVLVDRTAVRRHDVQRGDVVVFQDPGGWAAAARAASGGGGEAPSRHLVKRVVAVAGDRVSCCEDGALVLDGRPLVEEYLPDSVVPSTLGFDVVVPSGKLFVLGDNRSASLDSRALASAPDRGFVPVDDVVGVVIAPGTR